MGLRLHSARAVKIPPEHLTCQASKPSGSESAFGRTDRCRLRTKPQPRAGWALNERPGEEREGRQANPWPAITIQGERSRRLVATTTV